MWKVSFSSADSKSPHDNTNRVEATPETANCVSSILFDDGDGNVIHTPMLDLDIDARLVGSSTMGHHHLYINKQLSHEEYLKLITVLAEVGIVEQGILNQMARDGQTFLRLPGHDKTEKGSY